LYQLSERTAELEKTRSDLLVLRSEVMTKLPLIEMQVTSLSTNVKDLQDGLSGTNTTVITLRGEFDDLKDSFLADTMSLRTDLSATQGHVVTLTLDQERNQRDLVLVNSDLTKVSGRTAEVELNVKNIKTNVEDLRYGLSGTNTTIRTFRDEFVEVKNDFVVYTTSLRTDLSATQGHVVTLTLDQGRTQRDLVLVNSDLTKVSGRTAEVESDVNNIASEIGVLKAHAGKVDQVLEQNERRVLLLEVDVEKLKNA
jgi:uncharacterized protein Veg